MSDLSDDELEDGRRRINAFMRSICPPGKSSVRSYTQECHEAFKTLHAFHTNQIHALESRIAQLEARKDAFRGVYQRALAYGRGDQATHKGSLWVALSEVPEGAVPGEDPARWQLAAKGTG